MLCEREGGQKGETRLWERFEGGQVVEARKPDQVVEARKPDQGRKVGKNGDQPVHQKGVLDSGPQTVVPAAHVEHAVRRPAPVRPLIRPLFGRGCRCRRALRSVESGRRLRARPCPSSLPCRVLLVGSRRSTEWSTKVTGSWWSTEPSCLTHSPTRRGQVTDARRWALSLPLSHGGQLVPACRSLFHSLTQALSLTHTTRSTEPELLLDLRRHRVPPHSLT